MKLHTGLTKPSFTFKKPEQKRTPRNRRDDLLNQFEEKLNSERGKYKPLSMAFISMRMAQSKVKTADELQQFWNDCKQANHFSKFWYWSLKAK